MLAQQAMINITKEELFAIFLNLDKILALLEKLYGLLESTKNIRSHCFKLHRTIDLQQQRVSRAEAGISVLLVLLRARLQGHSVARGG